MVDSLFIKKIVFATANPHKIEELNAIIKTINHHPRSSRDTGSQGSSFACSLCKPSTINYQLSTINFTLPPVGFDPEETGATFEENSFIKAREANRLTGLPALADDSGLCVNALGGAPGIYSARYADTPQLRIDKLLKELEPRADRSAKFVCAMTLLDENGEIIKTVRGECHGQIALKPAGTNGFGYDPVFLVGNTGRTMAQMSEDEKNQVSHRALALKELFPFFTK
jgi:XTP/dITP diphosphohydrolase